ncbi:MAG TPA: hypothetical protein VHR45_08980 [Thermoanaerobaculia bacterium]|nr:hypothetical protein [Thermoanaerobaculia bacterium]
MAAKTSGLDAEIERLYRRPLQEFTAARNELAKRLRKSGRGGEAAGAAALAKPTPSAWAVNLLFERERDKMEALLAAGARARAGQRQALARRGGGLRESLAESRRLVEELRRLGAGILAEGGHADSRAMIERLGTNLQALAFSPAATAEASRRWLDRDLDPPGFEVLAGLQLASAPVVDLAARRAQREEEQRRKAPPSAATPGAGPLRRAAPPPDASRPHASPPDAGRPHASPPRASRPSASAPPPPRAHASPAPAVGPPPRPRAIAPPPIEQGRQRRQLQQAARVEEESRQQEAAERARREREEERVRRQVAAAAARVERARQEAGSLREEAERTERAAAELRRQAEGAESAARQARERSNRAVARLARAEAELAAAKQGH